MNPVLTEDSVNPNLKNITFPWPGKAELRACEIKKELQMGIKHPFQEIYYLDSANPHAMGQKPLTFFQQVASVCANKDLLESNLFPADVKQRVKHILDHCLGKCIGSYSLSFGIPGVTKQIAKFLDQRDGVPAFENNIYLTIGASEGIQVVMQLFSHHGSQKPSGILTPVPQYPLFAAEIARLGMHQVKYYLDEEKDWSVNMEKLQRAVDRSRSECDPKALVIINPGNPGGYNMTREDIEEIVMFAYKENLFILADEVYQLNVYNSGRPFISFKKVMFEMGEPYRHMQLASFMSASKGFMGECGMRSGFFEIINVEKKVTDIIERLLSLRVCPPTLGQAILYCICYPPEPDEPSYELYEKEKNEILLDLKSKAEHGNKKFNSVEGMSSAFVDSSMFFYPRLYFSKKALKVAEMRGLQPDEMYCMEMVEQTGIITLPGCAFGQKPGTYHFRYSYLYPTRMNNEFMDKIIDFHENFMERYAD